MKGGLEVVGAEDLSETGVARPGRILDRFENDAMKLGLMVLGHNDAPGNAASGCIEFHEAS